MFKKILLSIFLGLTSLKTMSVNIELITNNDSTNLTISKNEVRQLFLLKKKRLKDGTLTTLVQMDQSSYLHKKFLRDVLKISSENYNKIINNSNNSGTSSYVIVVNTQSEMVDRVANIPNSIGYIENDFLLINSLQKNVAVYKIVE